MTKFLNISTDTTLGGSSASDSTVSSQKAIKAYVDGKQTLSGLTDVTISNPTAGQNLTYDATNQVWKNTSTSATVAWGGITGTMSDQTDLKNALDAKYDASNPNGYTSNVGTVTSVNNVSPVNGNVTLSIPTVDQTYDATSSNAQSGVAINGAKFLQNTATNTESLTIYGDASNRRNTINIGAHSSPTGVNSVMIGAYSQAGEGAFAIGNGATAGNYSLGLLGSATANYAYQIGRGTNTETNSLYVGWGSTSNYKLLGSDGKIPDDRINTTIARATDIPTVNNATLTIQKNGTTVKTFTANASTDVTANITVPTKVSDLSNDSGFISGITSSDVTTALGYTPYNSTNPSGYQANVIETVKVNNTALTPSNKAVNITVPTNNNQLTNGAGYITSSALSGYATETWVGNQGYITGITSSDVTTALGYTPYNSSNPSGYQANVIETVKVNGTALTPSSKAVDITVPAAQVNSDWNASTGVAQILNKPSLATVATSGSYTDLSNKPTIPTVNNATLTITQGGTTKGTFTANASSNVTIDLDAGGGSTTYDSTNERIIWG